MTRSTAAALAAVLLMSGCGTKPVPVVTPPPPGPTAEQKLTWILELEDQRMARGPADGQDLVTMLTDPQAHIRRRAALAAGRAGIVEAVTPLSAMLATEPDPEVCQMAAFALGLIGSAGAADALTTALTSPDPLVQGRAAEALGVLGHKAAAPAIAAMMTPHVEAGVLATIAPDDVGYPKNAAVEAVRLGLYALVRLGRTTSSPRCSSTARVRSAAGGGRWVTRSSESVTRKRPRSSRPCFRGRDRSRGRSPRAGSEP